jgi:tetratricopeptide (TPR) repeat protein
MRKMSLCRSFVLLFLFFSVFIIAQEAFAIDILEIRVRRLYKEAETLTGKGDYDAALQAYNKAINIAKDKDIKQFLVNARKELQKKRHEQGGERGVLSPKEEAVIPVAEKVTSGVEPEKSAAPEKEQVQITEGSTKISDESTNYRYQVKDILNNAQDKLKETASKAQEEETRERIEAKINKLKALDQQAEALMSQRQYEKARDIYEEILNMSKDTDIKEYLKKTADYRP